MPTEPRQVVYRFGAFELDPAGRELRNAGVTVPLEPQAFDLLVHLVDHRDRVVSKPDLLDGVWGHRFLSEAALTTRIKEIRRAVGDDGVAQHTIRNVRGRGYRFVAALDEAPAPVVPGLIGRDEDLARVADSLRSQALVTLTGPGGVGKTALARALLADPTASGPDGGHLVDLGGLAPGSEILASVALPLEVALDVARPSTAVTTIARLDALVVLDNCEHVTETAAALVEQILAVPGRAVRLLVTSRSRLGLGVEWVHEVAPLDPQSALELFDRRARAAGRPGALDHVDRERLSEVLARLDRLPLTIEMAAARLGTMTFDDMARALAEGAPVLRVSHRAGGHRHHSLTSLVAWSVGLLPDEERRVFEDCAVFAAAVDVTDAGAVLGTGPATATHLADLADRSLLVADLTGRSSGYRMLLTVRACAEAGLDASGRSDDVRARHARHFAGAAAEADRLLRSPEEPVGRQRLARLVPELRAAQHWARVNDRRLADSLYASLHAFAYSTLWNEPEEWARAVLEDGAPGDAPGSHLIVAGAAANRGLLAEARMHAHAALRSNDAHLRGAAWEVLGDLAIYSGDREELVAATQELGRLARALDDPHLRALETVDLALGEAFLGDPLRGFALLDELDVRRCSPSDLGWLSYARGELLWALGDGAAGRAFLAAVESARSVGNRFVESVSQLALAATLSRSGDLAGATAVYRDIVQGYLRHGNLAHALTALRNLVEHLAASGDVRHAVTIAGATFHDGHRESYGAEAERLPDLVGGLRTAVGDDDFGRWWQEGAASSLDDAIRLAATALDALGPEGQAR